MKRIIGFALILMLIFSVSVFAGGAKEKDDMMKDDEMMSDDMAKDDEMMSDDAMEKDDEMMKDEGGAMMSSMATKMDFTTLEDAVMYAESGPTVLLFVDGSKESEMAVMTVNDHFGEIPPHVTLITVPYGNTELRTNFKVTQPGTFVIIDGMGMSVTSWTGGDINEFNEMLMKSEENM